MMDKFKHYGAVAGAVLLAAIMAYMREKTGIPISLFDLIFSPGALLFIFVLLRHEIFDKKSIATCNMGEPASASKIILIITGNVMILALGVWAIWVGIQDPFAYFPGIRGSMHGYSFVPTGALLSILGSYGLVKVVHIGWLTRGNSTED